jgi:hypothetical protein
MLALPGIQKHGLYAPDKLHQNLTREMVVIKDPMNPETSGLLDNASHLARAFDSQFVAASIGGRNQNLNAYSRSVRWTIATENQCPVQRNVASKASTGAINPIVPIKDHGKLQPISC